MDIICFHKITYEWVYDFPNRKWRSETRLVSQRSQNVPLSALRTSTCVCRADACCQVFNFTERAGIFEAPWVEFYHHQEFQTCFIAITLRGVRPLQCSEFASRTDDKTYVIRINFVCKNPTSTWIIIPHGWGEHVPLARGLLSSQNMRCTRWD